MIKTIFGNPRTSTSLQIPPPIPPQPPSKKVLGALGSDISLQIDQQKSFIAVPSIVLKCLGKYPKKVRVGVWPCAEKTCRSHLVPAGSASHPWGFPPQLQHFIQRASAGRCRSRSPEAQGPEDLSQHPILKHNIYNLFCSCWPSRSRTHIKSKCSMP